MGMGSGVSRGVDGAARALVVVRRQLREREWGVDVEKDDLALERYYAAMDRLEDAVDGLDDA